MGSCAIFNATADKPDSLKWDAALGEENLKRYQICFTGSNHCEEDLVILALDKVVGPRHAFLLATPPFLLLSGPTARSHLKTSTSSIALDFLHLLVTFIPTLRTPFLTSPCQRHNLLLPQSGKFLRGTRSSTWHQSCTTRSIVSVRLQRLLKLQAWFPNLTR